MNFVRVAIAAAAAWVVSIPVGYVVNEILLKDIYVANAGALRSEAAIQAGLPLGFVFMLVGFFIFAYAYAKGYEGGNGTMEGLRFGVIVALFVICFAHVWTYVVFPITGSMGMALMIDGILESALYGAIVGSVYKPAVKPAHRAATV